MERKSEADQAPCVKPWSQTKSSVVNGGKERGTVVSVPSPSEVQATFCATLVDELVRHGLRDAVICPGSRSTPLALALHAHELVASHVRVDERGAGFFALGMALATKRPVLVLVTSGTAAAELHAAVAEADQSHVPLLIVTADRPPELHGVGAPQTMPQRDLYGVMVRHFEEPGVARVEAAASWRPLASRLWAAAANGPVHVNAAFIEPLVAEPLPIPEGRAAGAPWRFTATQERDALDANFADRRVLVVAGGLAGENGWLAELCERAGWALIGDVMVQGGLAYADGFLRHDEFAAMMRPDLVLRVGRLPASKVLQQRLREWESPTIGLTAFGPVADPDGLLGRLSDAKNFRDAAGLRSYRELWLAVEARGHQQFAGLDFASGALTETSIARRVVASSNETGRALVVGSSMPVREVEWFAHARRAPVFSNRGVNGIDGVLSTTFGVATALGGALGLVGDVTFMHDVSALVDQPRVATTLVVVDNDGGHIFDFLPQHASVDASAFAELFTTARHVDVSRVAAGFDCAVHRVRTVGELDEALATSAVHPGVSVVVAYPTIETTTKDFHSWLDRATSRVANEFLS